MARGNKRFAFSFVIRGGLTRVSKADVRGSHRRRRLNAWLGPRIMSAEGMTGFGTRQ